MPNGLWDLSLAHERWPSFSTRLTSAKDGSLARVRMKWRDFLGYPAAPS
jgi:hypothetical protein